MLSNAKLFSVGKFDFRLQHLLIIGILSLSFTISILIRSQAADYGFELNEFDPFFNFRATEFIVENGFDAYFKWHDDMSWHPHGRNVSETSQIMLHLTAASLYPIFNAGHSLYDFTIIFPVVFGAFTAIVVFALIRVIGGTTAGLFASLLFSLSVPVIIRGTIGWFKSEPLGLFFGLLGVYLFLSGIKSNNHKIAFVKLVSAGVFLVFGLASWGGIQFFVLPLGIFFMALPFLRKDHKFIIWAIPVFVGSLLIVAASFARPGIPFVTGIGGFALIGPTIFLIACIALMRISKEGQKIRNGLALLGGITILGIIMLVVNQTTKLIGLPTYRYLNAINPFLTTKDPLIDSVAEHATTTLDQSFYFLSILMIFAGIGIWIIFRAKDSSKSLKIQNDMIAFALIIGLIGVYISSAFIRLEIFASVAVVILASIGLAVLSSEIFSFKREGKKFLTTSKSITKISFVIVVIGFLISPVILPVNATWINAVKAPPTILNGGTQFNIATTDWPHAMDWIKSNTPEDAVIASWWDYGYWITTLGERTSLADNATLIDWQIKKIAQMFLSSPDDAWNLLQELDADYVLVYVAPQKIQTEPSEIYLLTGGADESKKQWFIRIAGEPLSKYLFADGMSGTDLFWNDTILGKMFPFTPVAYVNFANNLQIESYSPGYTPIYVKDVKYPSDSNGPLRLVYQSPSLNRESPGPISGVLIYEINKNYNPTLVEDVPIIQSTNEFAIVQTTLGDITIEFKDDIAPKTVDNFVQLAKSGFYDGTIFHRIIPNFVIQGGDPNTISGSSDTWGTGGPGYSIAPEFSNLQHKKYIVSMARGADVNSAGSQFFIMLGDSPWLDGQYTIFGEVISGQDVVDKIGSLETNEFDQPINIDSAKIEKISIIEK